MLYIVLVLVLAALGLLVTALITATSLWAWVSIGLSVLAGVILVADWLRRRRPAAAPKTAETAKIAEPEAGEPEPDAPAQEPASAEQTEVLVTSGDLTDEPVAEPEEPPAEPAKAVEKVAAPGKAPAKAEKDTPAASVTEGEPGEEPTSAADLAAVSELDDEVVVVDEFPRYHLTDCGWLGSRDTIPIGVGEARQLGFTPCDRCTPDRTLVAAHRKPAGRSKS